MEAWMIWLLMVLTVGAFFPSKRHVWWFSIVLHVGVAAATGYAAVRVFLLGEVVEVELLQQFMGHSLHLVIDYVSAFFILTVNFTVLMAALYSRAYLKPYHAEKNRLEMGLHHFCFLWLHLSMLCVTMFRDGYGFLVAWEMMAISSFFLVMFDSAKQETVKIALNYLMQMHVGLVLIMVALIVGNSASGGEFSFEALSGYFLAHAPLPLFLLFFAGFGIKAGFVPLHSWLPHAHPAAPSHVSAVMSGVMIKMGIYGILRVLTYLHTGYAGIGLFILGMSILSGLLGVMYANVQQDVKKLLAYCSIENIGIIGIGIGAGLIGIGLEIPALAALGFTGGLLHILSHSLYKSLLFFSAGSVYLRTHTRQIEKLGGLIKKMPKTALFFLIGALAICGLPPFNGFISEFMIYTGLYKGLRTGGFQSDLVILAAIVGMALIGGLAILCFTKVFSVVFLGKGRSEVTEQATEVSAGMLVPQALIVLLILGMGLMPVFFVKQVAKVAGQFVPGMQVQEVATQSLWQLSLAAALFLGLVGLILFLRSRQQKKVVVENGPTWGCGYTGADPARSQYTASSFADHYRELVQPVVKVTRHYQPPGEEEIFPAPRDFHSDMEDVMEENLVNRPVRGILLRLVSGAVFQTGKLQHYMLYAFAFMALVFLLTFFNLI